MNGPNLLSIMPAPCGFWVVYENESKPLMGYALTDDIITDDADHSAVECRIQPLVMDESGDLVIAEGRPGFKGVIKSTEYQRRVK